MLRSLLIKILINCDRRGHSTSNTVYLDEDEAPAHFRMTLGTVHMRIHDFSSCSSRQPMSCKCVQESLTFGESFRGWSILVAKAEPPYLNEL